MDFIKKIEITGFRGFEHLIVDDLAQINLFVGKNSVGKTALLEALFLACSPNNYEVAARLNVIRGLGQFGKDAQETFRWLFNDADLKRPVTITDTSWGGTVTTFKLGLVDPDTTVAGEVSRTVPLLENGAISTIPSPVLRMSVSLNGTEEAVTVGANTFNSVNIHGNHAIVGQIAWFLSGSAAQPMEVQTLFSQIVQSGGRPKLIQWLKKVDSRVESLEILSLRDSTALYAVFHDGFSLPVKMLGAGFNRALDYFLLILGQPNTCLMIDEIEEGIHHSALESVWHSILVAAVDSGVQIFATTHSYESLSALNAAHGELLPGAPTIKVTRLVRREHQTVAVNYDDKVLSAAVEMELEVR